MSSYEEYEKVQRYRHIADIGEGIYLGSAGAACAATLTELDIGFVIHLIPFEDSDKVYGITYSGYLLSDDSSHADRMIEIAKDVFNQLITLVNGGKRVLICCSQGKSRSAAIVAYWIMNRYGIGIDDAINRISKVRRININRGFYAALSKLKN